jgi:hypothetical protein
VGKTKKKRKPTTARDPVSHPRRWLQWAGSLLLAMVGCTETTTQVPTSAPPVPAGQARVWFYRDWESSESLNLALVDMNGSYAGAVANGSVFYRDVPPGHYHIAPQSYGRDINQDKDVDVAPGNSCIARSYHHAVGNWAWAAPNPASIATPVVRRSTMTRGEEMGFEPPVPDIAWMARVRWRC